jgi:hypothetical protein
METSEDIRTVVRDRYARAAENDGSLCGGGSCCGSAQDVDAVAQQIGYKLEDLKDIPAGANLGLGCGNPLEYAQVKPGDRRAWLEQIAQWHKQHPNGYPN